MPGGARRSACCASSRALIVSVLPATPIDAATAGVIVTLLRSNAFGSSALLNVMVKPDPGRQPSPYPHWVSVTASAEYVVAVWVDAVVVVREPSADGVPGPIEIVSSAPFGSGETGRKATHRPSGVSSEIWCIWSWATISAVVARRIATLVPPASSVMRLDHRGRIDALIERRDEHAASCRRSSSPGANVSTFGGGVRNVHSTGCRQLVAGLRRRARRNFDAVAGRHREAIDRAGELEAQRARADPAPPTLRRAGVTFTGTSAWSSCANVASGTIG